MINIKIFKGEELLNYTKEIAHFRIKYFREYPYLYVGDLICEQQIVHQYALDPQALLVLAYDKNKIVGISTGLPLASDSDITFNLKKQFLAKGKDPKKYYYYGEIIILPEYRGQKLAKIMYSEKEKLAIAWGYANACILTVSRSENDPRKPEGYKSNDSLWTHLKFKKNEEYATSYHWNTMIADGKCHDVDHDMDFWEATYPCLTN